MNQLSRSTGLKIAAIILWVMALLGIIVVGLPYIRGGISFDDPVYGLNLFSSSVDVVTVLVAYGVWRAERWGIILAIVISVFNAILNTGGALLDPNIGVRIMAGTFVFAAISVIYFCLRRDPMAHSQQV